MNKRTVIADTIFILIALVLMRFIDPAKVMLGAYCFMFFYLHITKRNSLIKHLIVASIVAFIWMNIAKSQYSYNHSMFQIFGMNAFPFFAWSIGLLAAYTLYSHAEKIVKDKGFIREIGLFSLIYMPTLFVLEAVGYNLLGIHNIGTGMYPPLPFCNCFHAPLWMQISYFALGPIYFAACYALNLEDIKSKKAK